MSNSESLEEQWKSITDELVKMEKIHDQYIVKLKELTALQESCQKAVKHQNYLMGNLREHMAKEEKSSSKSDATLSSSVARIRREMEEAKVKLRDMQNELPVRNNGFYLNLILGSNLNVSLLTKNERYRYKQEYEQFKYKVTFAIIMTAIVSYFLPYRAVDSILNFLLVWYYCTLTIRESILQLNGSKIKGWWVLHHYISTALAGIVLTWKEGECYKSFRHQFIFFVVYLGIVQLAQRQYQLGTLRRLHALGQGHQMDITVEGFTSWQFKGLTFLLPFLLTGYLFQLYNAYTLYYLSFDCKGQWQVAALSYTFLLIAVGNIYTTSLVILRKFRTSQSYSTITGLSRKYRSRAQLHLMDMQGQEEHDHRK